MSPFASGRCLAIAVLHACATVPILPAVAAGQVGRLPPAPPAVIERIPLSEPVAVIEAAYQLADGSVVVVADPRSSEPIVFVIDSTGKSRRIGRKGDGPGEYQRINAEVLLGDSIGLFERNGYRFTVLDLATGRGRTEAIDPTQWRNSRCLPEFVIPAGVVCERRLEQRESGIVTYALHWVPFGVRPESTAVLFEVRSDSSRFLRMRRWTVGLSRYLSWGQRDAYSPSHRMLGILTQRRFDNTDSVTVRMTNLPTGISSSWTIAASAIRLTSAERAHIVDFESNAIREGASVAGLPDEVPDRAAVERALGLEDVIPAYRMVHISDDGCTWLRRSSTTVGKADAFEYDVFDFSGRLLKSVRVAMPVRLSGVTCNDAIGILFEESGELGLVRISPQPK
jgi:hypothetical protein